MANSIGVRSYGYAKHQERCANCDEQVSAALRFAEIGEEPPEVLELECGHVWHRIDLPGRTDLEGKQDGE